MQEIPEMLTVNEIASVFGIARHYARMLALNGTVRATRAGNKILINKASVIDYFNNCTLAEKAEKMDPLKPIPVKSK